MSIEKYIERYNELNEDAKDLIDKVLITLFNKEAIWCLSYELSNGKIGMMPAVPSISSLLGMKEIMSLSIDEFLASRELD